MTSKFLAFALEAIVVTSVIIGSITLDTFMPLAAAAAGVAAGVIYLWRAPKNAALEDEIKFHKMQIGEYVERLRSEQEAHDETLAMLRDCRIALHAAGVKAIEKANDNGASPGS